MNIAPVNFLKQMFSVFQNEGHTPLHISAWEGDESMIKYLQSCKANPNIIDKVIVKRVYFRVPTRTGKPGKWEGIFQSLKSQGILNRLVKSGKIMQNTGKLREFLKILICYFFVLFK